MENRLIENLNEVEKQLHEVYEKLGRKYYEEHFEDEVKDEHYADFFLQIESIIKACK